MSWWWPAAGLGALSVAVHAWDVLKEVTIIFITSTIVWPQVNSRVLPRERTGHSKHSSNKKREDSTHGHHQMINTKIRLIIFFAAKDREALHSQQKQDWELTVAQIMNSLLSNSDLN